MPSPSNESDRTGSLSVASLLGAFRDFRRTWPQLLLCHLLSGSVQVVVVGPLIGGLLLLFLAREGEGVLTDAEIATYLFDPLTLSMGLLVGAVAVGVAFARTSLLLVIGFGAFEDSQVTYLDAIRYVMSRSRAFGRLGGGMLVRLLLVFLPFLVATLALYPLFLAEHDINYYLADRPPEFQRAAGLAAVILAVGAGFILRLVAGWIVALPILLFEDVHPRQALRQSWAVTAAWRGRIVLFLGGWFLSAILLSSLVSIVVGWIAGLLGPHLETTELVMAGLVVAMVLAGVAGATVQFFTDSVGPLMIVRLYRAIAGPGTLTPQIADPGSLADRATVVIPGRTFLAVAAIAPIVALSGAYFAVKDIGAERQIDVIAHRGASKAAPENTMAAFERARKDGADFVELDVQESAEGEVIVAHDSDFMKQSGVGMKVWDATEAVLADLDIGTWFDARFADQRVLTLREVLEWASQGSEDIGVVIELKYYGHNEALERRVAELVEDSQMASRIKVMSLKREGLGDMAQLRPDWPRGLLNTASIGDLTKLDVDFLALNAAAATSAQIRRAHKRGMEVYVWTINDPVQMFMMMSRGADGIITDRPAAARRVLEFRDGLGAAGRMIFWAAAETGVLPVVDEASSDRDA